MQWRAVAAHVVGAERVGDDDDDIRRRNGSRLISGDHGSLPENLAVERGETDVDDTSRERREIHVNSGAPSEIARPYEGLHPPGAAKADRGVAGAGQLEARSSRKAHTEDQLSAGPLAEAAGRGARRAGRGTHLGGLIVIIGDDQPVERRGTRGSSRLIGFGPVEVERDPILAQALRVGREADCMDSGAAAELQALDGALVQKHVSALGSLGARRPAAEDQPAIARMSELDIEVRPPALGPGEARSTRCLGRHGPAAGEQAEATLFLCELERSPERAGSREPSRQVQVDVRAAAGSDLGYPIRPGRRAGAHQKGEGDRERGRRKPHGRGRLDLHIGHSKLAGSGGAAAGCRLYMCATDAYSRRADRSAVLRSNDFARHSRLFSPAFSARRGGLLFVSLLTGSCGYALAGRGVTVDPTIKVVAVPMFVDRTAKPGLDETITNLVIEELLNRGRFDVVSDTVGADAIVEGTLTRYQARPVGFEDKQQGETTQTQASRYAVTLTASVRYAKVGEREAIWETAAFQATDEYDIGDADNFFDREEQAIDRLAEEFSRRLVAAMLEAF